MGAATHSAEGAYGGPKPKRLNTACAAGCVRLRANAAALALASTASVNPYAAPTCSSVGSGSTFSRGTANGFHPAADSATDPIEPLATRPGSLLHLAGMSLRRCRAYPDTPPTAHLGASNDRSRVAPSQCGPMLGLCWPCGSIGQTVSGTATGKKLQPSNMNRLGASV